QKGEGARASLWRRCPGRREAIRLGEGHRHAEEQRSGGEEPEGTVRQGQNADHPAGHRGEGAHHETEAAAQALHEHGGGGGGQRRAHHGHRRGQGGPRLVAGEGVAGEASFPGGDRPPGGRQRLREDEEEDVPESEAQGRGCWTALRNLRRIRFTATTTKNASTRARVSSEGRQFPASTDTTA